MPISGRTAASVPDGGAALQDGAAAPRCSECRRSPFPGPDPERLIDRQDEDLAVADLPGSGCILDGLGHDGSAIVVDQNLQLHLGQELDHVLRAPIELRVSLLAPEALHLGHGHALDPLLRQRLLHLVELERLDDGFDLLHRLPPWRRSWRPMCWRVRNPTTATDRGPWRTRWIR